MKIYSTCYKTLVHKLLYFWILYIKYELKKKKFQKQLKMYNIKKFNFKIYELKKKNQLKIHLFILQSFLIFNIYKLREHIVHDE